MVKLNMVKLHSVKLNFCQSARLNKKHSMNVLRMILSQSDFQIKKTLPQRSTKLNSSTQYLNKGSDGIKVVDVLDDLADVVVVAFDENSCVRLMKPDPPTQHRHQVLVSHLHDLDELGKDRMLADGDDGDHGPLVRNCLSRWHATCPRPKRSRVATFISSLSRDGSDTRVRINIKIGL